MSAVAEAGFRAEAKSKTAAKEKKVFNFVPVAIGWFVLAAFFVSLRLYQQAFAFKYGLDSTTPEFQTYWVTLFQIEVPAIFTLGAIGGAYLWFTRDKNLDALTPEVELRRYFGLIAWFLVYAFSFVFVASVFGEADATWHQTVIRDTALTPSHIVTFYASIPTFISLGACAFLYAMTRIPMYSKNYSVPLIMVVFGPALILPNLGFNEWGHAFWFTEEVFSHPLHWGFPIIGWMGLAVGGVLVQGTGRMAQLFKQIDIDDRKAASA